MNKYVFTKALLMLLCVCMLLSVSCAESSGVSQSQSALPTQHRATISREPEVSVYEAAKRDLSTWPERLWTDSKTTFTRHDNITALLLAGGASVLMHQETDEKIADYFAEHRVFHDWKDETLNVIGSPTTQLAATSVWYFFSARNNDTLNRERAWTMRTALTISWLTTWGLKLARDNETPNDNDWSWPSGHAASSFTAASVLDEFYGHKVGVPAYAIASLVSWRMMDTGDHWGSDIVFGATLGWVVGHTVASQNRDLTIAGFEVVPFTPVSERPAMGIGLMKRF
ncbi:MAG: phosphatase PAP2 family protein [Sedimentisphaerales bacterium]